MAGRTATGPLLPGGALVLSPHQDDETIGCGLLMAEKANRGIPVAVVVVTDGRAGWHSPAPRPDPNDIVAIRHREWHRALDELGVRREDRYELDFPDGELGDHEIELTERLGDLLRRVRPSQVFAPRPCDPHPDHRTLARAVGRAASQIYDFDPGAAQTTKANGTNLHTLGTRPQIFTYRVYPGAGLWPNGRPPRVTVSTVVSLVMRSLFGLIKERPLLFRAPGLAATKIAAIGAYDSQSSLLRGELRYVWGKGVELYWPIRGDGSADARIPSDRQS